MRTTFNVMGKQVKFGVNKMHNSDTYEASIENTVDGNRTYHTGYATTEIGAVIALKNSIMNTIDEFNMILVEINDEMNSWPRAEQ